MALALQVALIMAPVGAACADGAVADVYHGVDSTQLAAVRNALKAAESDADSLPEFRALLTKALPPDAGPGNPVLRAYGAVLEGLEARSSRMPHTRLARARKAIGLFDTLVEEYPGATEIRMLRFSFLIQLPAFFNRRRQAAEDLEVLAGLFELPPDPNVPGWLREGWIRWILEHGTPPVAVRQRLEALAP